MAFFAPNIELSGIAPELALSIVALVLLVGDAVGGRRLGAWFAPLVATAGFGIAVYFAVEAWSLPDELQLADAIAVDGFSSFVKVTLGIFGLLSVWLAHDYLRREELHEAEFYALMLFAAAGMMLMASAADLILMFVALETFSISLYVLVGYRRRSLAAQEGAMKYFLLGAFSSAFFLLGIALAYGAVGGTNLYPSVEPGAAGSLVSQLRTVAAADASLLVLAAGLIAVGLGFKVAAVPFHMWTPDAYQGAPSPVTGFMAAATKIAAFAAIIRIFDVVLYPLRWDWRPMLLVMAVLTMVVGSVVAVVQEDVKRILAYSSIAHAGFLFTGVVATNDGGVSGALFYLATYGITVMGAFAVVAVISGRDERRVRLVDYRGLFFENPMMAAALTLFMLSLAGVPVTVGFVGKLVVFRAAVDAGYSWLVVVGVLASAIAAFVYLRLLVVMYMQEPDRERPAVRVPALSASVVGLAALATLGLGLQWSVLIELAEDARIFFSG